MSIEDRVSKVEAEQARQGEQLNRVERDVGNIGKGVEKLLERDAKRPAPVTWGSIAGVAGGLISVGFVIWWRIGTSPAVQDLDRRVTKLDNDFDRRVSKLDDPDVGRVKAIERRVDKLDGWQSSVVRN
jgi:hypothetical protein